MNKLIHKQGEEFYEFKNIKGCRKDFYQNLYFNHTNVDDTPLRDVFGLMKKKSDEQNSASLEGETPNALKNMKNNKSPGLDGFTVEFFFFF